MPDIFLSYSREDQAIARQFAAAFESSGLSVWWDQTLNAGEAYDKVTEKALEEAKAVVVLWSKASVDSRWVRSEATQANSTGTLVPAMIESCKRPVMFELTHTADLSRWKGDSNDPAWQAFLAGVQRFVGKGAAAEVPRPVTTAKRRIGPVAIAIPLCLLLIAGGAMLWMKYRPVAAPKEVTLAVLPFANMSSDPEQEYFSDGLSEELLNQLAQIPDLRVTARTSSFAFKGKNQDVRVIGKTLNVANVLEGSVRKDGAHLKITAQLIDARTGTHLFSQTFDRDMVDIFAIQEDIARLVANALSVKLGVGKSSGGKKGTANVEAYEKYLLGLALGRTGKGEDVLRAVQLLREAVALDPTFVDAWLARYVALGGVAVFVPGEADAARRELEEIRTRLSELAPDSPVIVQLRASTLMAQHRWAEAESTIIAQTQGAPAADLALYSILLAVVGRTHEAIEVLERIRRADPLPNNEGTWLHLLQGQAGRRQQALAEYERIKEKREPIALAKWNQLCALMATPGTPTSVIEAQFRAYLKSEDQPMELDRLLVEQLGDRRAALDSIRKAFDQPANQNGGRMNRIVHYADHFGDPNLALSALRRQLVDLDSNWIAFLWGPYQTGLRADPAFKALLRDLGLADYYRTTGKWPDYCKATGSDDFECR